MTEITKIEQSQMIAASDPMLSMIERVLTAPDVPMDRISAMMDLRERQMDKEAEQAFNAAFAAAMAEMQNVPRTGHNKHSGQRYSTLDDLIKVTRPVLSRHGLSLNWQNAINGDDVHVTAIVRHAQGHQISTTLSGKRDSGKQMNHLQGGGSSETYLKRYSGFAILGLSSGDEVDDDGKSAQKQNNPMTADQYQKITDLIERTASDEAKLCAYFKVEELHDMTAQQADQTIAMLTKKLGAE